MSEISLQRLQHSIDVGDRVTILQGQWPLQALVGREGMVVEVFRLPLDSCMVRIDGDRDHERERFFYRDELALSGE